MNKLSKSEKQIQSIISLVLFLGAVVLVLITN
jgi:hypothetical protein